MRAKVQHGDHAGEASRPVIGIETAEDYERARHRVESLRDSTRGEDEEHELQALLDALRRWDAEHPPRAGRQRRTPS